ncbi:unnamed protein product, partial [Iphiclides podalirius]
MVLTGLSHLNVVDSLSSGHYGDKRNRTCNSLKSENILLNLCKACETNMASIPPSAFSAGRIREAERNMKISNIDKGNPSSKVFNINATELTPLKYNSKLMNSIWGFYNRYSPHNVKKVNDVFSFNAELQQSAVNSSTKNDPKIVLSKAKLDNMWATINVSQSQI